jgi:hypothetical protein
MSMVSIVLFCRLYQTPAFPNSLKSGLVLFKVQIVHTEPNMPRKIVSLCVNAE